MEQLPILVEDLAIRDLSNAVCVATCKYQADAQARQYGQQLGIDALMQRLAQIAANIRQLMSQRYAALIRALNDNIDYTRRHAMHRKQKSDEPQPDGGGKE